MAATFFSAYPGQQPVQTVPRPVQGVVQGGVPGISRPGVSGGTTPFLSAKDIQYKQPGSVSNFYGMTPENVFAPGQFLDKFYNDAVKGGVTTGGNEGILKTLRSVDYANNPQQFALLQQYLNTGQVPAGLDPNYAIGNYDYAIREQGRQQQTKSPSLLGSLLKGVIGPAVGFALAGPFGAALGGGIQGGVSDGPLGAVLGGLGGYGFGSGLNSLGSLAGLGSWNGALGGGASGFANPSALGLTGSNLSLPGLAFGPGSTAVSGYGASALGLNGANLALPGLVNAGRALSIPGYGASAVGGNPSSLYTPGVSAPVSSAGSVARTGGDLLSQFIGGYGTPYATGSAALQTPEAYEALAPVLTSGGITPAMESFFTPVAPQGGGTGDRFSVYRNQLPQLMGN